MSVARFLKQKLPWYFLATLILASGFIGFNVMGALKTPIEPSPPEVVIPQVSVIEAKRDLDTVAVKAKGFVQPFRSIQLAAQASGRILEVHPALESLGTFQTGETLVRLDDRQAQAQLASARANLELVTTQLKRAQQLRDSGTVTQDQIDQLSSQSAQLKAALQSAQISLDNSVIQAPFAGQVSQSLASLGSVINPGQAIAEIYTHDVLEVTVSLTEAEAALIPDLFAATPQIQARVISQFGQQSAQWSAQVHRVNTSLDAQTRTLQVTVRIDDPAPKSFPLLPNAYVDVELMVSGGGLAVVPTSALRANNQLWLVDQGTLKTQPIELRYIDQHQAYIRDLAILGTAPVVFGPIPNAREGMNVRTELSATAQASR